MVRVGGVCEGVGAGQLESGESGCEAGSADGFQGRPGAVVWVGAGFGEVCPGVFREYA